MTDEEFADMMQIGVTDEMKGIKINKENNIDLVKTEKGFAVNEMYSKLIWNEAIEAAAKELQMAATGTWVYDYLELIRKLKK